jgi:hypothetical protein
MRARAVGGSRRVPETQGPRQERLARHNKSSEGPGRWWHVPEKRVLAEEACHFFRTEPILGSAKEDGLREIPHQVAGVQVNVSTDS